MMKFRVIFDKHYDGPTNMAIDEAILRLRKGKDFNTIRMYQWSPSAVSIGYFQSIYDEVNLQYASQHNISVVRRITGGGAVYHDHKGDLTYSIVVDAGFSLPSPIMESYRTLGSGILQGLKNLGLDVKFTGINDISIKRKKISGNAQTRKHGAILQHGTILLSVNPQIMFSVLKVGSEKISDKLITSIYERVTSLERENINVPAENVKKAIFNGYKETMPYAEFFIGTLDKDEIELSTKLRTEKYLNSNWTFQR